jgi:hypothetical protein
MKKLFLYFALWPVIKHLKQRSKYYWDKRTNSDFLQYAKLIVDKYFWELKSGRPIPSLIEAVEAADSRAAYARCERDEEIAQYRNKFERLEEEIKRFELEVIHLKDLIQEKNMVIDRLNERKIGNVAG